MRKTLVFLAAAAAIVLPARLDADEKEAGRTGTYLKVAMTTEDKYSRDEKTVFPPDAPAIFAAYRIVADGPAKVTAVFWADAVEGLEPKTRLLEKVSSVTEKGEFMGAIPVQRPANGWPLGTYRVELFVGETLSKTLVYKVAKSPGAP